MPSDPKTRGLLPRGRDSVRRSGVAFLFNAVHSLGISYFVGTANTGDGWSWSGIPAVNLLINLRTDWKYVPARTTQIG